MKKYTLLPHVNISIESPPIDIIKKEKDIKDKDLINIKLKWDPNLLAGDNYDFSMYILESVLTKAWLWLLTNYAKEIMVTGTHTKVGNI